MDLRNVRLALEELAEEKGIAPEKIIETIEMALAAAYKRDYGKRGQVIRATFDLETGEAIFRQVKTVVDETMLKSEDELEGEELGEETHHRRGEDEEPLKEGETRKVRYNPERHIMIKEARTVKPDAALLEEIEFPLEVKRDYGRIAAQTAKQVIIQRVREAEREAVWDEFKGKEGEVISGIVQRVEGRNVFLDLGRATALLPYEEQIPHERYRLGERIKAMMLTAERGMRGPGIYLTRSHPKFVAKLFEIEVPEIAQGSVEVKSIARESGSRSKVAVTSHEDGVDPVGALVGQKGVRVNTVIAEIGGEKIDIIEWSTNPERFIASALSPAKVLSVDANPETREAAAFVDPTQLSLAIGRGGQNVRLAAKLTGWKIDVRSSEGDVKATSEGDALDVALRNMGRKSESDTAIAPDTDESTADQTQDETTDAEKPVAASS